MFYVLRFGIFYDLGSTYVNLVHTPLLQCRSLTGLNRVMLGYTIVNSAPLPPTQNIYCETL